MRGSPAPVSEAPLWVVGPHSSMLDMFIMATFHLPTYVAKHEVRSIPLFGCKPFFQLCCASVPLHGMGRPTMSSGDVQHVVFVSVQISSLEHFELYTLHVMIRCHGSTLPPRSSGGPRTRRQGGHG